MISQHEMLARGDFSAALAMRDTEESINDEIFRSHGVRRWHGTEDLSGKSILVTHQWGLGDCILALRYVRLLGAEQTSVAVPEPLVRLAAGACDKAYGPVVPVEWFDFHVPIMRLLGYFDHAPRPPYLRADVDLVQGFRRSMNGRRRVGIAWRGNPRHLRDATRSMTLETMLELVSGDCQLYSLQNLEVEEARSRGVIAPDYADFAEVAAVASMMDEIVTVDTAAANLVGAMGLTATVLLDAAHDWRWHRDFYPTLTKRVQRVPGDWASIA